jgi:uncharacterized protein (TIGR02301 family)
LDKRANLMRRTSRTVLGALTIAMTFSAATLTATAGGATSPRDIKPYDDRLMRLVEILGAVHFLRELCGASEGQFWRERMEELMRAEGSSALRQARLTRGFNQGYRNYARTYTTCTPTAQTTITRFLAEGAQISDGLVKSIP